MLLCLSKKRWIFVGVGVMEIVAGFMMAIVYFSIRTLTSSTGSVETIPTYINAILILTAGVLGAFIYKTGKTMVVVAFIVLNVITLVACTVSSIMSGTTAVSTFGKFESCVFFSKFDTCLCRLPSDNSRSQIDFEEIEDLSEELLNDKSVYQFKGTHNCIMIEKNLRDFLYALCGIHGFGVILTIIGTMAAFLLLTLERIMPKEIEHQQLCGDYELGSVYSQSASASTRQCSNQSQCSGAPSYYGGSVAATPIPGGNQRRAMCQISAASGTTLISEKSFPRNDSRTSPDNTPNVQPQPCQWQCNPYPTASSSTSSASSSRSSGKELLKPTKTPEPKGDTTPYFMRLQPDSKVPRPKSAGNELQEGDNKQFFSRITSLPGKNKKSLQKLNISREDNRKSKLVSLENMAEGDTPPPSPTTGSPLLTTFAPLSPTKENKNPLYGVPQRLAKLFGYNRNQSRLNGNKDKRLTTDNGPLYDQPRKCNKPNCGCQNNVIYQNVEQIKEPSATYQNVGDIRETGYQNIGIEQAGASYVDGAIYAQVQKDPARNMGADSSLECKKTLEPPTLPNRCEINQQTLNKNIKNGPNWYESYMRDYSSRFRCRSNSASSGTNNNNQSNGTLDQSNNNNMRSQTVVRPNKRLGIHRPGCTRARQANRCRRSLSFDQLGALGAADLDRYNHNTNEQTRTTNTRSREIIDDNGNTRNGRTATIHLSNRVANIIPPNGLYVPSNAVVTTSPQIPVGQPPPYTERDPLSVVNEREMYKTSRTKPVTKPTIDNNSTFDMTRTM